MYMLTLFSVTKQIKMMKIIYDNAYVMVKSIKDFTKLN